MTWLAIVCLASAQPSTAQDAPPPPQKSDEEESDLGWTSSTELSYVAAYGNSETETLGLRSLVRYRWAKARYTLRVDGLRSNNADSRFVQILTPSDGEAVVEIGDLIVLVKPKKKLDAEKYLIENIYDRAVSDRLFWNVGFTWDRNKDANILNRYLVFFGLGNVWWARDALHLETTYGLSYTDRNEERTDVEKQAKFPGLRLAWTYWNKWGKVTTLGNNWASNLNLSDSSDWTFDTTSYVTVAMNSFLAIKVSLQWLYNSRPALEKIDVRAILPEGVEIDFGDVRIPKQTLDTVFNTSIVFSF